MQKHKTIKHVLKGSIQNQRSLMNQYKNLLSVQSKELISKEKERIHFHENTARLINPENVLKRGYTLTLKEGKIVKSTKQLTVNEDIETRFAHGIILSKITKKDNNDN
jgi:exodeoxyribonuclease VII large subunit